MTLSNTQRSARANAAHQMTSLNGGFLRATQTPTKQARTSAIVRPGPAATVSPANCFTGPQTNLCADFE